MPRIGEAFQRRMGAKDAELKAVIKCVRLLRSYATMDGLEASKKPYLDKDDFNKKHSDFSPIH